MPTSTDSLELSGNKSPENEDPVVTEQLELVAGQHVMERSADSLEIADEKSAGHIQLLVGENLMETSADSLEMPEKSEKEVEQQQIAHEHLMEKSVDSLELVQPKVVEEHGETKVPTTAEGEQS